MYWSFTAISKQHIINCIPLTKYFSAERIWRRIRLELRV